MTPGERQLGWLPPKGWDIADAVDAGWTWKEFLAWARPLVEPFDPAGKRGPPPEHARPAAPPRPDMGIPITDEPPPASPEDYGAPGEPPADEPGDAAPAGDGPKKRKKKAKPAPRLQSYVGEGEFRCLGFDDGIYYFHPFKAGQVVDLTPASMSMANLLQLAPLQWWELSYPNGKGAVDETGAKDALMRACHERIFDPSIIRGRGAWEDEGRCVLHLGGRLVVDGAPGAIKELDTGYIYERGVDMGIEIVEPASNNEAFKLVEMCRMIRWEEKKSGDLLAGWLFVAPVCGAMLFRSHLYMIGTRGSGKSWVIEQVVQRYLQGIGWFTQGKTTEAAIRQHVKGDAIPIVFDEAEAEDNETRKRLQGVFDLARQASSPNGAPIHKGSSDGRGQAYHVRCTFCFASINMSMGQAADESRTVLLRVRTDKFGSDDEREADRESFRALEKLHAETFTEAWRDALVARAMAMIPTLRANHKTFAKVATARFGSRRMGDTLGMILAGLYGLHATTEISEEKAAAWLDARDWTDVEAVAQDSGEDRLLQYMAERKIRIEVNAGAILRTVGELALVAGERGFDDKIDHLTADDYLRRNGFAVEDDYLWISNTHSEIARMLRDTEWATKWHETLSRIDGALRSTKARRFKGTTQAAVAKAVGVPLTKFA